VITRREPMPAADRGVRSTYAGEIVGSIYAPAFSYPPKAVNFLA
jgi:hypothetical protein